MAFLSRLTTSIWSNVITTPPAVPQGMFVTLSVYTVTYTFSKDVTKGSLKWYPGSVIESRRAPPLK